MKGAGVLCLMPWHLASLKTENKSLIASMCSEFDHFPISSFILSSWEAIGVSQARPIWFSQ